MRRIVAAWSRHPRLPWALAAFAVALSLPALWAGPQVDDYLHAMILRGDPLAAQFFSSPLAMFEFMDGDPVRAHKFMDLGIAPWWALDTVHLAFCRPITVFTHWLDYRLWPNQDALMHLQSLLWLAALVAAASVFYRRIMGVSGVAALAGLLYAVDDAHAMPTGWLANRNALISAFFCMLVLIAHDAWRRRGKRAAALVAPVCLVLGLLSNEGAIAACAYVFAYALFVDPGRRVHRAASLIPYAAVVVVWRVMYTRMGFGAFGSETYIDPLSSSLRFLTALWTRGPVLLLGQWALPPSDIFTFMPRAVQVTQWLTAIAFLLALAYLLWPVLRRDAIARFWCVGMLLSVMPCCATFPADRLMTIAGVGAMGLLAQLLAALFADRAALFPAKAGRMLARAFFVFMIAVHLVLAPILLPLRIYAFDAGGDYVTACLDRAPLGDDVADKTVVVLNAPNFLYGAYLPIVRAYRHLPLPRHCRSIGPNGGLIPEPIRVTRLDDRTLALRPRTGFPWLLMRDRGHPFTRGDTVQVTGMSVEVTEVAPEGWPQEAVFRFDAPLEDPKFVWLEYRPNDYEPFTLPAVGESVMLNE